MGGNCCLDNPSTCDDTKLWNRRPTTFLGFRSLLLIPGDKIAIVPSIAVHLVRIRAFLAMSISLQYMFPSLENLQAQLEHQCAVCERYAKCFIVRCLLSFLYRISSRRLVFSIPSLTFLSYPMLFPSSFQSGSLWCLMLSIVRVHRQNNIMR